MCNHQMLLHKPKTLEEMAELNGVGPQKLDKYGEDFLAILIKKLKIIYNKFTINYGSKSYIKSSFWKREVGFT